MAERTESTFDRARFQSGLATRRLGRHLIARAAVESTNDVAWEALAAGAPEGATVVADAQTRGRGRGGRTWHTAPGMGLALSVLVFPGCDVRHAGWLPLIGGLALARGLETLGARAGLKWPNDLLMTGRKLAGILCERRRGGAGDGPGAAVVMGAGVNVRQTREDWPPDLRDRATSLALEGIETGREEVAAAFLNALERLLEALEAGGIESLSEAWSARAAFWDEPVRVRTPSGVLEGVARGLDERGALVLGLGDGREVAVLAGDVDPAVPEDEPR